MLILAGIEVKLATTHLLASFQVNYCVKQGRSSLLQHFSMVPSYVTFVQVQSIIDNLAHAGKLAGVQGGSELLQKLVPARMSAVIISLLTPQ